MASRKMTFTVPDEVADRFLRRVPSRQRSHYVAEAITAKLNERDARLKAACEALNNDPDVQAIEQEWDTLVDTVVEPWD